MPWLSAPPGDDRKPRRKEVALRKPGSEAGEEQQGLPGGELDSDKLMQELQDFLRKQREGGGGS